jgi:hypothetical protein
MAVRSKRFSILVKSSKYKSINPIFVCNCKYIICTDHGIVRGSAHSQDSLASEVSLETPSIGRILHSIYSLIPPEIMSSLRAARVRWNLLMERRGHRPFRTCPTCGSSLSAEWPYLDPTVLKEHKHNLPCWKSGKAAGCDFCSVVTLVIHHANTQHSLKPLPVDGFQLRHNYNNVDIEVSWGKKFDRFVLTLGYFSDRAQIWFYSFTVHPESETFLNLIPPTVVCCGMLLMMCLNEERNRLLGTPYSRLIDRSTPEAINLIRWWMTTCERDHTSCRKTSNGFMPIRLLHIADGMISLQLNVEETKPYMALSHCWGPVKPIMLLKRSLELFQKCIPWADLPRTFREAVALARGLGFEYIWIDTLCIIQVSIQCCDVCSGRSFGYQKGKGKYRNPPSPKFHSSSKR